MVGQRLGRFQNGLYRPRRFPHHGKLPAATNRWLRMEEQIHQPHGPLSGNSCNGNGIPRGLAITRIVVMTTGAHHDKGLQMRLPYISEITSGQTSKSATYKRDTHESEFFQTDYQAGSNLPHCTVHSESVCDLHEVFARLSRPCISHLMSAHNPPSRAIM